VKMYCEIFLQCILLRKIDKSLPVLLTAKKTIKVDLSYALFLNCTYNKILSWEVRRITLMLMKY